METEISFVQRKSLGKIYDIYRAKIVLNDHLGYSNDPCYIKSYVRFTCIWLVLCCLDRETVQMRQGISGLSHVYEPCHEKTNNAVFEQVQTELYKHRIWLEAGNFKCRNNRNCTIWYTKTKALISFAVSAKLICVFVFAYAKTLVFS